MKARILIVCFLFFQVLCAFSQAPEKISYQATIRNADNTPLSDTQVAVKIAVLHKSLSGTSVYEERHALTTSSNGVVNLMIGDGTVTKGDFASIDWSQGPYFVETSVDINGGSSYRLQGSSQLLSVPYALHSKTAERIADDSSYVTKAKVVSFDTSRNIDAEDIGSIIECSTDATLTLTENFDDMQVGDVINIEAHNGAMLVVETSGQVELNYKPDASAVFESEPENVRFGLLRKIDVNSYIISGQ